MSTSANESPVPIPQNFGCWKTENSFWHRIPEQDLNYIKAFLNANSEEIRNSWIAYHGYEKYRAER